MRVIFAGLDRDSDEFRGLPASSDQTKQTMRFPAAP
jgi:hypothetical protein